MFPVSSTHTSRTLPTSLPAFSLKLNTFLPLPPPIAFLFFRVYLAITLCLRFCFFSLELLFWFERSTCKSQGIECKKGLCRFVTSLLHFVCLFTFLPGFCVGSQMLGILPESKALCQFPIRNPSCLPRKLLAATGTSTAPFALCKSAENRSGRRMIAAIATRTKVQARVGLWVACVPLRFRDFIAPAYHSPARPFRGTRERCLHSV